jgi:hypothetical protein
MGTHLTRALEGFELARPAQHLERGPARRGSQADSFLRPLARRAARTRRPPFVFMRARKPCSLARCRFLG